MEEQNKNLILATVLSFLVILVWFWLFPPEEPVTPVASETATEQTQDPSVPTVSNEAATGADVVAVEEVADAPRIAIETEEFTGSISLLGGRIDDLKLNQYKVSLDEGADIVQLLKPVGEAGAYFTTFGWAGVDGISDVPGPDTLWSLESGDTLTVSTPVTLVWDNGAGQIFRTEISVDDSFMFSFAQSVENTSGNAIALRPYGLLRSPIRQPHSGPWQSTLPAVISIRPKP